jgi:hypothetical protein
MCWLSAVVEAVVLIQILHTLGLAEEPVLLFR